MTEYLVAIDGGGTKTEYLLADLDGQVVKTITHGPTNITAGSLGQAAYNLREGMRLLLEGQSDYQIASLVMAVAGLDTPKDRQAATSVFREILDTDKIRQFLIVNDAVAALINGTSELPAVVLVAGTGASCLGKNARGQMVKVSGLDYLLADDGSGYDAGRLTLKAAVQSTDGRGQKTKLQELVFSHFGVENVFELKDEIYSPLISKEEVASFAADCLELARQGDSVARAIIDYCQGQLLLDVQAVAARLGFADEDFTLIPCGSFLLAMISEFRELLQTKLPHARLVHPDKTPVYGSLEIAKRLHAGENVNNFDIFG